MGAGFVEFNAADQRAVREDVWNEGRAERVGAVVGLEHSLFGREKMEEAAVSLSVLSQRGEAAGDVP